MAQNGSVSQPGRSRPGRSDAVRTYRGRSLEEILPQIREELGPDAVVLRRREGLAGGVGGFFQRRFVEVDAAPGAEFYDARELDDGLYEDEEGPLAHDPELAATAEGLRSPAIRALLGQAAPFADALERAQADPPGPGPAAAAHGASAAAVEPPSSRRGDAPARPAAPAVGSDDADLYGAQPAQPGAGLYGPQPNLGAAPEPASAGDPGASGPPATAPANAGFEPFPAAAAPPRAEARPSERPQASAQGGAASGATAFPAAGPAFAAPEPPPAFAPPEPPPLEPPREPGAEADLVPEEEPAVEAPAPVPAPGLRRPPAADAAERRLVAGGVSPQLAASVVAEAVAHGLPFGGPRQLKKLVRSALARRIRVLANLGGGGRSLAFVGAGGAGKTLACARLAAAYAENSDLPVVVVALRPGDGGAELRRLLEPHGVAVHVAESGAEVRARLAGTADHALALVDTPGLPLRAPDAVRELARDLARARVAEVHVALPATMSSPAIRDLLTAFAPLGPTHVALTHADATDAIGAIVEECATAARPLSYISAGPAGAGRVEPADPAAVAAMVLP